MDIIGIEKSFDEYSKKFDLDNYKILHKYYHSYNVEGISNYLAKKLLIDAENIDLATTIGLLHDIGRYKQLELTDGYNDQILDHADLGIKILFGEGLIKKFPIEKKYYDALYLAIKNHNKYEIEPINDDNILYHSKLIRDSDKIDILDGYVKKDIPTIKSGDNEVSLAVKNSFYKEKSIKSTIKEKNNRSDAEILRMALIFDINFDESILLLQDKKIMENYYELLKGKRMFIPYLDYLSEYVKKRSKSYVRKKV